MKTWKANMERVVAAVLSELERAVPTFKQGGSAIENLLASPEMQILAGRDDEGTDTPLMDCNLAELRNELEVLRTFISDKNARRAIVQARAVLSLLREH